MQIKLYILGLFSIILFSGCAKEAYPSNVNSKLKYTDKECRTATVNTSVNKVDKIVINKSNRTLYTYKKGKVINSFKISLGKNGDKGHKERIGDNKTPEGTYSISYKQYSRNYYKSLKVSYPNKRDLMVAKKKGLNPGGFIMIHGQPKWNANGVADKYMLQNDWTRGCIALTNRAMDQLYYAVESGVRIEIKS